MGEWFEFGADETPQAARDRRLMQMPVLSASQEEQLWQLRACTWDGNLISKSARTSLILMGLIVRFNGWQVVSEEGLAVLETLGRLRA